MVDLKTYRMDLHQIPELGFEEYKTKAYIMKAIKGLSCTVHEVQETGLVLYFDLNKEKTIAFRADMDALPIEEATDLPFSSIHNGKMHACGHDGHMAILIGLAHYIHERRQEMNKNVVLVFQPSEEREAGARIIIESGLLDHYQVEAIFGLHLCPGLEEKSIYSRANELMATGSEVSITVRGKSVHVANSDEGIDALYLASLYLGDLYQMEATEFSPHIYRLLKFGAFHSGTVRNAISDKTTIDGTLRSFSEDVHQQLKRRMQEIANKYEKLYQCRIHIDYHDSYDAVINDPVLLADIKAKIPTIRLLENPVMHSEDFGLYRQVCPSLFFFLGVGETAALHNEQFDFDMDVLQNGLDLFVKILKCYG